MPRNRHRSSTSVLRDARQERWRSVLKWWPAVTGAAFALGATWYLRGADDLAAVLVASAMVYLGAAALKCLEAAWGIFLVSIGIAGVASVFSGVGTTTLFFLLAGLFLVIGLWRGATSSLGPLPLQALAMIILGGAALIAMSTSEQAGRYLVAGGLFFHAGWDAYHHWRDKVVSRSYSKFCFVVDIFIGGLILLTGIGTHVAAQ